MDFGYAGNILKVNLSSGQTTLIPTAYYAEGWLGGRGIALKIYWDEISPAIKAFDAENCLIFTTGPLAGFPGLAGSRTQVCGKSPGTTPDGFSYASLGGSWGVELKRAGFDGIVIQGKSDLPVYLFVQDGKVEIRHASNFWGKDCYETSRLIKKELGNSVKILSIGLAGENKVKFATLIADDGSTGSSGFGAVMGSKNLKAIAVKGAGTVAAADPEKLHETREYLRRITRDRTITPPNFALPQKRSACYGCITGCLRTISGTGDGESTKSMCQAAGFYVGPAMGYYKAPTGVPDSANRLCNSYGLDTMVIEAIIIWLLRCRQAGIITDEVAGIPLSKFGSLEFIEGVVKHISMRNGFGDVLAQGIIEAADMVGNGAKELIGDLVFPPPGKSMSMIPGCTLPPGFFTLPSPNGRSPSCMRSRCRCFTGMPGIRAWSMLTSPPA